MKLSDIFDHLAYGDLSQLGLAASGEIISNDYNRLIGHINLGLTELHKRFVLRRKQIEVQTQADKVRYPLIAKYSESAGAAEPYIMDGEEPFLDDIITVLSVQDSHGRELRINEEIPTSCHKRPCGPHYVYTPAYNILRFEDGLAPDTYRVAYQANHPIIPKITEEDLDTYDPSTIDIELPMTHLEALLYFVASKVTTPMSSSTSQDGVSFTQKFEAECQQLMLQGLDVKTRQGTARFHKNGFI